MYEHLKYVDEVDKSLGVAGMTIALMACDGENCITSVSIEEGEETLDFSPEASFPGNPRFSARIAWSQLMREFQIFSGMVIGNVVCRNIVAKHTVRQELIDDIHELILQHGREICSLDDDEIDSLFDKDMRYFRGLFNHPGVSDVARSFATNLRLQRRMSAGEVFEQLSRLSSI